MVTPTELQPVTDLISAAAHIEGLLDFESPDPVDDDGEARSGFPTPLPESQDSDDLAPDESPISEETDEDPSDLEAEPHSIAPPSSWNAADKKAFAELSPEIQATLTRRESERDTAISQRMNQLAEQRKAVEADVARAADVQAQYANTLHQLLTLTIPELNQIENVDWMRLSRDDPAEYVRLSAVRDGLRQRVAFMEQQTQQATQQQHQQLQQTHQARLSDQYQQLIEQVPEFREPATAKALVGEIGSTMAVYGFSEAEIGSVADSRVVRVMARLAQLEKVEAARKSALTKRGPVQAPRFISPNAAPVREVNQTKKLNEQYAQLRKSGSARDAARLLENIL